MGSWESQPSDVLSNQQGQSCVSETSSLTRFATHPGRVTESLETLCACLPACACMPKAGVGGGAEGQWMEEGQRPQAGHYL